MQRSISLVALAITFQVSSLCAGGRWTFFMTGTRAPIHGDIVSVGDSAAVLNTGSARTSLPIDSIAQVVEERRSHFWTGAAIGGLAGGVAGGVIGNVSYTDHGLFENLGKGVSTLEGTAIGIGAGFLVGGLIGAETGADNVYDLGDRSVIVKRHILMQLLSRQG